MLGPIEVRRDGRSVAVPRGKTSELLVRLALEAGHVVATDRLLDDLWGGIDAGRNTLQSKVAKLRRALGDPKVIVSRGGGYHLDVERTVVDALGVTRLVTDTNRLFAIGDHGEAAALAASALALFRGDVLPAAGDGEWVLPHRARLDEARMQLVETGIAARIELGDTGAVIGELGAAVTTHPFQEGLWELLITAQYRAGRQAEALAAYQRVRGVLADELGLEPGPKLKELERQILSQDPTLGVRLRASSHVGAHDRVGNLPSMTADLVGRDAEVRALTEMLDVARLVEIIGPGGIGKTATAIAVGHHLSAPDAAEGGGAWLARLETATTGDEVVDTVIAAFGITGEAALLERLRGAEATLILDNCEHVVDEAAALAIRLLDAAPGLRILCTSQVPLGVDGEVCFELRPLSLAEAVELFTQRAARRLTLRGGPGGEIDELCRSLDGLPLAIELAAARTRTLSVAEITRRLDDRFEVLSDPASRRPERRRALKSTISWSYDLLFPDDQRGLWALAPFAGGATLAAVESVLESLDVPASAAIDVVGRLASRSLLIVDEEPAAGPSSRYRLLDSIRAFALDAATGAGLAPEAHDAHAAWFATAAASSTDGVRGSRQAEHLAFARTERANLDVALTWSAAHDPRRALAIANGFGWAWIVLGDSRGAQRILTALDAVGGDAPAAARATAMLLAGWIEASTGNLELARGHVLGASALATAAGDVDLEARAAYHLAYVVSHQGSWGEALALTDRSRALYEGLDRPWDQAANELFAARAAISAGEGRRAAIALEAASGWLGAVHDPWLHVRHEAALGELARVEHRFDDAVHHLGRAVETSGRLGFKQTEAYQTSSLGRAQGQAGHDAAAAATLQIAIDRAEATGDVRLAALARVHLGRILRTLGRTVEACSALESANQWHRKAGGGEQAALGECLLAAMDAAAGRPGAAERLAADLDRARLDGDAAVEVFALDGLARLAAEAGNLTDAQEMRDIADRRMESASHFITDRDRVDAHAFTARG